MGPEALTTILQICECYEELGEESGDCAAEMARVIRAVEHGGTVNVMEGRVASAISSRFPPDHPVWRHVRVLP